jgi:hypothetical protein
VAGHPCRDYGDVGAPKVTRVREYKRPVTIGELNNAYRDTTGSFAYGERADSQISVGLSLDGDRWSLEGSTHVGNSESAEVGIVRKGRYARRLRSNFIFSKYKYSLCPAPHRGSHYYRIRSRALERRPVEQQAGEDAGRMRRWE